MKVFKFGGASVKDPSGVRNVAAILQSFPGEPVLVVVSAMGKTTNALEKILDLHRRQGDWQSEAEKLKLFHLQVMAELLPASHPSFMQAEFFFAELEAELERGGEASQVYDQVVSIGELVSTLIVHAFAETKGMRTRWFDARALIATDSTYREGRVQWDKTKAQIKPLRGLLEQGEIIITQGFIGADNEGKTTTLGRDGSDYSAAIFASCLEADSVTIWKDVPGVMSADPKRIADAVVFEELPFREAAEMTYYGASVIHPKTIKPLANRNIPLYVKSFDNPALPGTKIHECKVDALPPLIVFKENQCLISCKVTDYTFITEDQMSTVLNVLHAANVRINVMQNSAISFSFCMDYREDKLQVVVEKLQAHFEVYYNTGLVLITVKNYDDVTYQTYRSMEGIILEQSSRSTLQVLLRPR